MHAQIWFFLSLGYHPTIWKKQPKSHFFFCTDFTLFSFLFQRCCQWFQPGVRTDVPSRCLGKNVATFWLFFPDRGTVRLWPATRWEKKTMFEHAFVKNCLLFLQVGSSSCTLTAATFWVETRYSVWEKKLC